MAWTGVQKRQPKLLASPKVTQQELDELEAIGNKLGVIFFYNEGQGPFFKAKLEGGFCLYVSMVNQFDGSMTVGFPPRRWQATLHPRTADWRDLRYPDEGSGWVDYSPLDAYHQLLKKSPLARAVIS